MEIASGKVNFIGVLAFDGNYLRRLRKYLIDLIEIGIAHFAKHRHSTSRKTQH